MNINYDLWNTTGESITIPTNAEDWPAGDALVGNFVYNQGKLAGFVNTKALTVNSSGSTTINYDYINIELPFAEDAMTINRGPRNKYLFIKFNDKEAEEDGNVIVTLKYKGCKTVSDVKAVDPDYLTNDIIDGVWSEGLGDLEQGVNEDYESGMFYYCEKLTSFSSDLSSLIDGRYMFYGSNLTSFSTDLSNLKNGKSMFEWCSNLESFSSDLSSLTVGNWMFSRCPNLTSFTSDLPNLTDGEYMFSNCTAITSFSTDLSNLTNGADMFYYCTNLNTFSSDLSNLTEGRYMFSACSNLTSFSSDLSSLTNGERMFINCSALTSFTSDLSSLTTGFYMFSKCKLDVLSVRNIIDTINTYSGKLTLAMGCNNTTEDKNLFAQEVGYTDMTSLLAKLQSKKWTVTAQYNGRPTTTYSLRRPSEDTLPVFVQLEEVEEYADYTSMDETKKFRLDWFHETTGSTDGYTQFNSLEEAIESLNIKPIERN